MSTKRYLDRLRLAELTSAPIGAGAFVEGNVLLIGEQASDPKTAPEQQPFCDDRGCSGWINQQLESEGVPEEKLFWLNALWNDGAYVNLWAIVKDLQPSAVVALGQVARRSCELHCVPCLVTYHPQYWKRFKSKHRYPLLDLLRDLLAAVPERDQLREILQA